MPLKFLPPALAVSLLVASAAAAEPKPPAKPIVMDVYVSTGDNHFLGSSLPIDSPASIEASFDLFKNVTHARRIYWRGLEEACWIATMHARPENCRYYSLWQWMQQLYRDVKPDVLAVKAAHARGMEIWGVGSLWDWGSPADTPGFNDYPFTFESKLKLEHPEWTPIDKHGARRQGGPIELAYPEARKALIDLVVEETLKAGYDGIIFLTYVENYSLRFADEFGYSDPIVEDFKRQYKLDLRREPFRRGASREDWLRLRGSYVTAYLRELKAELDKHHVKLGMLVDSNDPRLPQSWNVPELVSTAGRHWMDINGWLRERLVDELLVYGGNSGQSQLKTLDDLRFLARDTGVEVGAMTSGPFRESWRPYQAQGMPIVLSVSDDSQHLERGFVPDQTAAALDADDQWARMRALQQSIAGTLKLDEPAIMASLDAPNLIERRLALQALGKLKPTNLAPLVQGLSDPENGVRCMAALALGDVADPRATQPLLEALQRHGNHMLVECAVIALRRLKPLPRQELFAAVAGSKSALVRQAAIRALMPFAQKSEIGALRAALSDSDRFTRYAAAEALGNIGHAPEAVFTLIQALYHADPTVSVRAAVSLGQIAARQQPENASWRPRALGALKLCFERYGEGCTRSDSDWGWRPVGNALRAHGAEGEAALRQLRDQRSDMQLAELAWRVLDLHQEPRTFSTVTEDDNEAAYTRRPKRDAAAPQPARPSGRKLRVDPPAGDDRGDGLAMPLKTIARAIRLAQPGDTIDLACATYYEVADFTLKHGEIGRPITLDGHGAVLDGSDPVRAKDWQALGDGLFRKQHLMRMDEAILGRWFMLFDGRMVHMGRTSKGPKAPLKKPAELRPGEWTYVQDDDAFYIRIQPGQDLDAANVRYPARQAGIVESMATSHITIRNVTCTHVYNDGCNIHGITRDCRFENITALECGDDGFSAHDDCQCTIDAFRSIGNSTGLADTGISETHYRNVFVKDCLGIDVLFMGDGTHSITGATILSSANTPLTMSPASGSGVRPCECRFDNVFFRRVGPKAAARFETNTSFVATRSTFWGLDLLVAGGSVDLKHSIVGGEPKPEIVIRESSRWQGADNAYDLQTLRYGKSDFAARSFDNFRQLAGSERGSQWQPLTLGTDHIHGAPANMGATRAEIIPPKSQSTSR